MFEGRRKLPLLLAMQLRKKKSGLSAPQTSFVTIAAIALAGAVAFATNPVLTSISSTAFKDGTTGIVLTGTGFGPEKGSGSVNAWVQGDMETDTVELDQTITAWSDTSITITAKLPLKGSVPWSGFYNMWVNKGFPSNSKQVLIGPDQTVHVNNTEHASGMVLIDLAADVLQTVIDRESAGTAFHLINETTEKTISPRAADQYIAAADAAMAGDKSITEGAVTWAATGNNWKITSQTQSDFNSSFNTRTWHQDNIGVGDIWVRISGQPDAVMVRLRRYADATAMEAAFTTGDLVDNPFETTIGSKLVWVTKVAHGHDAGECVKHAGSDAVGGITPAGFVGVIQTEADRYQFEHDTAATSSATGGGTSVTFQHHVGCVFDSTGNEIFVPFDPTAAGIILRAATTARAFDLTGAIDDVVVRGQDKDNLFELKRFGNASNLGTIDLRTETTPTTDNFTLQFVHMHHHHANGIRISGDGHVITDCRASYGGQCGMFGSGGVSGNGLTLARNVVVFNCTADYESGVSAGVKILKTLLIRIDQNVFSYNRGAGIWADTLCGTHASGWTRNLCDFNATIGIFYEICDNAIRDNDVIIENNLVRENGWDAGAYNTFQPAAIELRADEGSTTRKIIARNNVVEIMNHPDKGPMNGIVISATSLTAADSMWNEVTDNRITILGTTMGLPALTAFGCFGSTSEADGTQMRDNAVIDRNEYRHTGPSSDKVFEIDPSGAVHTNYTWANFRLEDSSKWEPNGSIVFDALGSRSSHGDMVVPTWAVTDGVMST